LSWLLGLVAQYVVRGRFRAGRSFVQTGELTNVVGCCYRCCCCAYPSVGRVPPVSAPAVDGGRCQARVARCAATTRGRDPTVAGRGVGGAGRTAADRSTGRRIAEAATEGLAGGGEGNRPRTENPTIDTPEPNHHGSRGPVRPNRPRPTIPSNHRPPRTTTGPLAIHPTGHDLKPSRTQERNALQHTKPPTRAGA
jgi:hypothetical protein